MQYPQIAASALSADMVAPRTPAALGCVLPPNSKWCETRHARLNSSTSFIIAVPLHDVVGRSICSARGGWEQRPADVRALEYFVPQRLMLDIGANIGWFTFVFALRKWTVHAFEPMPFNRQLLNATLCMNPELVQYVNIHPVALGIVDKPLPCKVYSAADNMGDGVVCCDDDPCGGPLHVRTNRKFTLRGETMVQQLDTFLASKRFPPESVGFVKIDVEGYECGVLQGGKQLLQHIRPAVVRTEVNTFHSTFCTPSEYLQMYRDHHYNVSANSIDGQIMRQSADGNYFRGRLSLNKSWNLDFFARRHDIYSLHQQHASSSRNRTTPPS